MQPEVESLLGRLGRSVPSVSVLLRERQQLHRDGRFSRYDAPQWMTAWDTLYAALREPLPDGCYRLDSELASMRVDGDDVTAAFTAGHSAVGNVVVGADGVGSTVRSLLHIPGAASYSGYVAFRGLEPEADLPSHLVDLLAERFTMFAVPGLQLLCYLVPGAGGELEPGSRRVNWVWYVNTAESNLPWLLTGNSGRRFEHFVPPGELTPDALGSAARLGPRPAATPVRRVGGTLERLHAAGVRRPASRHGGRSRRAHRRRRGHRAAAHRIRHVEGIR